MIAKTKRADLEKTHKKVLDLYTKKNMEVADISKKTGLTIAVINWALKKYNVPKHGAGKITKNNFAALLTKQYHCPDGITSKFVDRWGFAWLKSSLKEFNVVYDEYIKTGKITAFAKYKK